MSKTLEIILIGIVGVFFSIATLEIDVFGYDNTFFDTYDSYIQIDHPELQHVKNAGLDSFAFPGITPSPFSSVALPTKYEESSLPPCRYERKRYIVQSSLLI